MLAPHARRYACVDSSPRIVGAARDRLKRWPQAEVVEGDMQALPYGAGEFDLVLLMHALTYAPKPALAIAEAARVLRRGGRLVAACLSKHEHEAAVVPFGHVNLGFTPRELRKHAEKAGLEVQVCEVVTREKRPPHFEVVSLLAGKP